MDYQEQMDIFNAINNDETYMALFYDSMKKLNLERAKQMEDLLLTQAKDVKYVEKLLLREAPHLEDQFKVEVIVTPG